ncbi:MAG TPA: ABC transporter permease [Stellaceae bacterium]|jgi:capsular polysaccharide transport system permease protein|nr:ABC transporter permease [Stellaceae bacterium]
MTFWQVCRGQQRILSALAMREIQTRWGRRNLGFAWLFCEPLVFAVPVLMLWHIIRPSTENGLPMFPFLWTGYLGLLIFRHVAGIALYVVRSNAALLYHSMVTPLDIFFSRCGLEATGNLAAVVFSFTVFYAMGILDWPYDLPLMFAGFLFMTWWALAVAMIVAALSERSEMVEHIWVPIAYVYIMLCGFPYMANWLPPGLRNVDLTINPPLLAYEMIRGGLYGNLTPTYQYPSYLTHILLALTFVGLWLMRHVREHIEIM